MATLSLSFDTTAEHDAALAWLLTTRNADAVHVEKPLPDVTALLTEMLQTAIEDAVPQWQQHRKTCIAEALDRATPDEWATIEKQLKVT